MIYLSCLCFILLAFFSFFFSTVSKLFIPCYIFVPRLALSGENQKLFLLYYTPFHRAIKDERS